jgi:uncharacterized membrane protein YgcG
MTTMTRMCWTAVIGTGLLFVAGSAQAQTAAVDPRYQPWVGCWRTIGGGDGAGEGGLAQPTRACVTPSKAVAGSVDMALYAGDSLLSRSALPRPGTPRNRQIDECQGTETAEWTTDETRLILRADMTCARGVRRSETGLMTITPSGEWLQMQHMEVAGKSATTAARFRYDGDTETPVGVSLGDDRSSRTLRLAVGAPVSLGELVDLSKRLPASLMEAWVAELDQRFTVDGKTLVKLADQGVPARVIDVIVATSHPEAFSLRADAEFTRGGADEAWMADVPNDRPRRMNRCSVYDDFCYGPGGLGAWGLGWRFGYGPWDPWDPWGYRYGNPYSRYGAAYGYPYGYGGGMYWGRQPIVIVNRPSGSDESTDRGRAVNGGGYTRTASPRPSNNTSPSARSGGSSSGSSGSGSTGSSGSSGSGSGSTGRTAKPRPPGGK